MTVYNASEISAEAYAAAKASINDVVVGMTQNAGQIYAQACATAMAGSALTGEKAITEAVQSLSEQGIYAYTYYRSDGTLVRVPCDVGIRRAVNAQGKSGRNQQILDIAAENDCDLIEVNSTPNCRDEHQAIDGQIFSLSGESKKYPEWTSDLASLLDDPNCQHEIAIYTEGLGSRFASSIQDAISDNLPDDWTLEDAQETGEYTSEQVQGLITQQRKLENTIRKSKRSEEVLKATGLDASKATATKNAARASLRELVSKNEKVLVRERYREQVYDSARRMEKAAKNEPVYKATTVKIEPTPIKTEVVKPASKTNISMEYKAVESYVSGEMMDANNKIRGRNIYPLEDDERQVIAGLDEATKYPVEHSTLYRSVDMSAVFGKMPNLKYAQIQDAVIYGDEYAMKQVKQYIDKALGKVITDKGFISTTTSKDIAIDFLDFTGADHPMIIEFVNANEVKGFDLAKNMPELNARMEQEEVLLQRGLTYKVEEISSDGGQIYLKCRFI